MEDSLQVAIQDTIQAASSQMQVVQDTIQTQSLPTIQFFLSQTIQSISSYVPVLLGALAILIFGWLIALILSGGLRSFLNRIKLNQKLGSLFTDDETIKRPDVARGTGQVVFWLIMIFVLMAFFQMLGITLAADPFSKLLVQIFQFGPNLFGAALLFLIAWLLGTVIRLIVKKLLLAAKFDERLSEKVELEGKPSISLTTTISDAVYWLVFLLFLPAILDALNLYGLLEPVQVMLHNFLGFLPNLLAALLIGFIGWFVARLVQRIVTNIIAAAGGDKFCERIGLAPLSKIIGLIVYILILIPVMIAALNTLELDAVTMPASNMLNMIFTAIPPIFAAVVMIFITYIVGRIAAGFITELLKKIGFDTVLMRIGIGKQLEAGKLSPSEIVGYIALVAIMLLASFEAASMLGFHTLSELMAEFTVFGGRILLGLVIFGLSLYLANVASKAIKTGGSPQADFLALLARISIILLAGAIALQHMGIATEIISLAFGLIVGSIAVAAALAFGIGGRDFAARKLQEWTKDSAK